MTSGRTHIFRVVAVLAGLFFVVAVVLMASAPWVLLQPDQQTRTELNRWFLAILAIGVVPLIAYPYLSGVRLFPSWWVGVSRPLLILAAWRAPLFL
jgi:succinate dehydrogenase/fumarate reductase cytochrome b subunit